MLYSKLFSWHDDVNAAAAAVLIIGGSDFAFFA